MSVPWGGCLKDDCAASEVTVYTLRLLETHCSTSILNAKLGGLHNEIPRKLRVVALYLSCRYGLLRVLSQAVWLFWCLMMFDGVVIRAASFAILHLERASSLLALHVTLN